MTRGLTGCWGRQATQGGMAVGDEGRAAAEAGEHELPRTPQLPSLGDRRASLRFLGCPGNGTRGFRTKGSSASLPSRTTYRSTAPAGSPLAAASSREGVVRSDGPDRWAVEEGTEQLRGPSLGRRGRGGHGGGG